jgi:hypothetical protein
MTSKRYFFQTLKTKASMRNFVMIISLLSSIVVAAQDVSIAANEFLSGLSPSLKAEAMFPFDNQERFNMNFVPMVSRGPTFHDFDVSQKKAALNLLKASLSATGYLKATQIIELENVLRQLEGDAKLSDGRYRRDPLNYHYCIFGTPSRDGIWGWRFEGHHISLNFVSMDGKLVSSTPSFLGSNPAIVKSGAEKGKQVLANEMNLGFELVNSFNESQLKLARFSDQAPHEILTGNNRKAEMLEPKGISYSSLSAVQKNIFDRLLKVYIDNYELGFSKTLMDKIKKAGIENLSFAWAGPLKPGGGEYYRIQGPMLLIEYDNTQNEGNHVHTVVRDLTNDFAEDILQAHYRDHHNNK